MDSLISRYPLKMLSIKLLIEIFDDIRANQDFLNSDTDMEQQNYFWLPNTLEFVAQGTTYACGQHFNVLRRLKSEKKSKI